MLPPEAIDEIRNKIGAVTGTPPDHVWVHTTHAITTPHAPHAPMGPGGVPVALSGEERQALAEKAQLFQAAVAHAVAQAAEEASRTLQSARMGVGTGACGVNVNRDIPTSRGWWIGLNPAGPSNHTATVLRFESEQGAPIANLISYALKPCAIDNSEMDQGTRLVSSDVPGLACRLLEEQFGAPCLFAMSAAGDQVPLRQALYDEQAPDGSLRTVDLGVAEGLAIVDELGRQMAREVSAILAKTVCGERASAVKLDGGHIHWPGKARTVQTPTRAAAYTQEGTQRLDVLTLAVGDVALVGLKPEMNTPTEAQLQAASPYAHTLVVSMVNGGQKYMPDRNSYENSTWEAQSAPFMPGAAEAWVEEAAKILNRMQKGED